MSPGRRRDGDPNVLYVTPSAEHGKPVDDELTRKMNDLLAVATPGPAYRGVHTAACGSTSSNHDLQLPDGTWTNSLAAHYLRWHRPEIPAEELAKVVALWLPSEEQGRAILERR